MDNKMDTEPRDEKTKVQWLKFFESDLGKLLLQDIKDLGNGLVSNALKATTQEEVMYYMGRASGVEYVLEYIMAGIEAGKKVEKESKKKA